MYPIGVGGNDDNGNSAKTEFRDPSDSAGKLIFSLNQYRN
jgi:hypothetical protein